MPAFSQSPQGGPCSRKVVLVIPCYQVEKTIAGVLRGIGAEVDQIICVDDMSHDNSVVVVQSEIKRDNRIELIQRSENGGVGAATMDGYRAAIEAGADIIVKIDGDGQMDPAFIAGICEPIVDGRADYVKGNRFFYLEDVSEMPIVRVVGNAGLSLLTKLSTGYWDLFDPTNGYTAIHAGVAAALPFDRINQQFFFESDMLFRLSIIRARVIELPMASIYRDQESHLDVWRCLVTFPVCHFRNLFKRIIYNYVVRNFSIASVNLLLGFVLCLFALFFGIDQWIVSARSDTAASAGTVMLVAFPAIIGVQMLLNFLSFDIAMTPQTPLQDRIIQVQLLSSRNRDRQVKESTARLDTGSHEYESPRTY